MVSPAQTPAPRWSVQAPVLPRGAARPIAWNATNISESGMFVTGAPLLRPGQLVDVDIVLPGAFGPSLEITSRVQIVWTRGQERAAPGRPSGMGVRFIRIDEQARLELKAYLDELGAYQTREQRAAASVTQATHVEPAEAELEIELVDVVEEGPLPPQREVAPPPFTDAGAARVGMAIDKGARLGSYEILQRLGSGGMGDVFLAQHTLLGRRVALKLLHGQHVHDRAALRRFFDEARLVNQICHDNIVQITDLVVQGPHVFIVMELLEGRTLSTMLRREGALPAQRVAAITAQLCSALDAVHRAGIVHRDIKPENIMLVRRGARADCVKLLDFGIAKLRPQGGLDTQRTQAGIVVGTPGYMSPEQLLGKPADNRSDLYALGVVMFAMLTGELPFPAASAMEMMLQQVSKKPRAPSQVARMPVPPALDALVVRCLDPEPGKRPASAAELVPVLRALGLGD